jgi:hypothetical protein
MIPSSLSSFCGYMPKVPEEILTQVEGEKKNSIDETGQEREDEVDQQVVYYPNNIGYSSPLKEYDYEFVLMGLEKKQGEALPKILEVFKKQKATLVSFSLFRDQSPEKFIASVVADLSHSKCSPEKLLAKLGKLKKFIRNGEMSGASSLICPNLIFPLTLFGGTVRALAIDTDRFTRLFGRISDELGDKAGSILYEDGYSEGKEMIEAIRNAFPDDVALDEETILVNAKSILRSLGWGTLHFASLSVPDLYRVTLLDPPTDANGDMAVSNHFLQGIIGGIIAGTIQNESEQKRVAFLKESYDKDTRTLTMFYMERKKSETGDDEDEEVEQGAEEERTEASAAKKKIQEAIAATSSPPSKEEITRQVELLIKSIDEINGKKRGKQPWYQEDEDEEEEEEDLPTVRKGGKRKRKKKLLLVEARRIRMNRRKNGEISTQNVEEILDEIESTAKG